MIRDDGHVIVDVRRQDEYDDGHIPGAILIPNESIETERPEDLPFLDQVILIYCRSGNRSRQAAQKLADMGYTNIYDFGGIQYRTGIYYTEEDQLPEIEAVYRAEEEKAGSGLAVEMFPLKNYFTAEEYHQKYLDKNPGGYCHIPESFFELRENSTEESEEELRARIGDLAFEITQNAATEYAFTGEYDDFFEKGLYVDVVSGEPFFTSMDKYDSGCGWPAFTKPITGDAVKESRDTSHGMIRTEVRSRGTDSHLGHVFDNGPKESGGLRYCINSAALRFIPYEELEEYGYGEYKVLFEKQSL